MVRQVYGLMMCDNGVDRDNDTKQWRVVAICPTLLCRSHNNKILYKCECSFWGKLSLILHFTQSHKHNPHAKSFHIMC